MSDHFLVVIPADPDADLPDTADALRNALAEITGAEESRIKDYGKLKFIDCGENFDGIGCPSCGSDIPVSHWHEWMSSDLHGEEGFHLHRHRSPCCGVEMRLNDLIYKWPQGFARWFVSARNVGRGPLTPEEIGSLEAIAGLPLKGIAQMY
ncbi:MAG: hypothetical protein KJO42_11385 [Silicimonas sp.]|nr:hypothetical protein [Silicimonas sp.]